MQQELALLCRGLLDAATEDALSIGVSPTAELPAVLQSAATLVDKNSAALLGIAEIKLELGDRDTARGILADLVKAHPDFTRANALLEKLHM